MNEYVGLYKKYEEEIKENRILIYQEIHKEQVEFEKYYASHSFCAERKIFSLNLTKKLCQLIGTDYDNFDVEVKSITKAKWKTVSDSTYLLLLFCTRAFEELKLHDQALDINIHLGQRLFSALHLKYWKYGCKEEVLNYTLNHISKRYLMRIYAGDINQILYIITKNYILSYAKDLLSEKDERLMSYVVSYRSRINSFLQYFAKEYYRFDKEGYGIEQTVKVENDKGETISASENDNAHVQQLVHSVNDSFIRNNSPDKYYNKIKKAYGIRKSQDLDIFWEKFRTDEKYRVEVLTAFIYYLSATKKLDFLCITNGYNNIVLHITSVATARKYIELILLPHMQKKTALQRKRYIEIVTILMSLYVREQYCKA